MKAKKTIKSKKYKKFHCGTIWIDVGVGISLLLIVLLELFKLKEKKFIIFEIPNDPIIVLLPSIITIVSIVLSVLKEKIYGAKINELNKLRGPFFYDFLHMVLIMCFNIFIYCILVIRKFEISILWLNIISLFYSFYFSIQEIPILLHNEQTINKMLQKNAWEIKQEKYSVIQKKIYEKVILYILLTDGMQAALDVLCNSNKRTKKKITEEDAINTILLLQNQYFANLVENVEIVNCFNQIEFQELNVVEVTKICYENIIEFLQTKNKKSSKLPSKGKNDVSLLVGTLNSLHIICSKLGMEKTEKKMMNKMIPKMIFSTKCEEYYSFSVTMLAQTLYDGDVWFAKSIRDNVFYPSLIFECETCFYGLFISIMVYHLMTKNVLDEQQKKCIEKFLKEPFESANSDGKNWINHTAQMFERLGKKRILNSIFEILKMYDSASEIVFCFTKSRYCFAQSTDAYFTKRSIFDCWIDMLLHLCFEQMDEEELKKIIEGLDECSYNEFMQNLSEKWIKNGEIKQYETQTIINFFQMNSFFKYENQSVKMSLIQLHDSSLKHLVEERIKINQNKHDYSEEKEVINKEFEKINSENEIFYDSTLSLEGEPLRTFGFKSNKEEIKEEIKLIIGWFSPAIIGYIDNEVQNEISKTILDDVKTENVKDIIQDKDINCMTYFDYYTIDREIFKDFHEVNIPGLSHNLFWKDKSIRYNAKLILDSIIIREYTEGEINQIINNEYTLYENGLYRFSQYGVDSQSFYVTRDELKEFIKKSFVFISFSYIIKIAIDKKYVLILKQNEKDKVA